MTPTLITSKRGKPQTCTNIWSTAFKCYVFDMLLVMVVTIKAEPVRTQRGLIRNRNTRTWLENLQWIWTHQTAPEFTQCSLMPQDTTCRLIGCTYRCCWECVQACGSNFQLFTLTFGLILNQVDRFVLSKLDTKNIRTDFQLEYSCIESHVWFPRFLSFSWAVQ